MCANLGETKDVIEEEHTREPVGEPTPDPDARVWKGDGPSHEQSIRVLGIPVGHDDFVQAQLQSTTEKHRTLFERLQSVQDPQSAWLLLLFCANSRATCSLRDLPPAEVVEFAATHDEACW